MEVAVAPNSELEGRSLKDVGFRNRFGATALALRHRGELLRQNSRRPPSGAATAGAILVLLTGCLTLEETYKAIDWQVIFLLAGVLSLGVALEKTGGAALASDALVRALEPLGPVALLSAFYLAASLLTSVMSHAAAAVLLAPVAIAAAGAVDADPRPFLMTVTFAASASFMTPVGYRTNTLIYGPGQYRFADFLRVGTPLNLLLWGAATVLIPLFWPL